MRKGGGKAKGSAFERQVCKDLSLWLSEGKQQDLLWRSAMSGGRSTVALKRGDKLGAQAGDISSIHRLGNSFIERFMIELKFYKDLNIGSLIKDAGNLLTFWKKAVEEANQYKKIPLLIAKQNHHPVMLCTSALGIHILNLPSKMLIVEVVQHDMFIVMYDEFLKLPVGKARFEKYDHTLALRDYRAQKSMATKRGIRFRFPFAHWVRWWERNLGPDWQKKRGVHKGQYCMARLGDEGPYTEWNVKCVTTGDNLKEKAINGSAARGERVNTSKLTVEQVVNIFYDKRPVAQIAKSYGVDKSMIYFIKKKQSWLHVVGNLPSKQRVKL